MAYLGTLHPTKERWLSINIPVDLRAIVLSFETFTGEDFSTVRSWFYLRKTWLYANEKLPEHHQKYYPREDKLLIPLDAAPSSVFLNSSSCSIEILKFYERKRYSYVEPDWFITFFGIG